jgi:hypothetical protein
MSEKTVRLLVGDNPFHGISHLSQERARLRAKEESPSDVAFASQLVRTSLDSGASGFMFSVSETTLSILKSLDGSRKPDLYAIVPYAYEYVRLATRLGGMSGLAKRVIRQIAFSGNLSAVAPKMIGLIRANPSSFLNTYLIYEISRIRSVAGKGSPKCVMLHEIVTDMALAFNLDWLLKSYIKFMLKSKIKAGFETRNFAYLVNKFKEWNIDLDGLTITAPFNKVGFQMNPSQRECEKALENAGGAEVIAMSILASGYLKPPEAVDYLRTLPNIKGVVVGVSKKRHAEETFALLRETFQ